MGYGRIAVVFTLWESANIGLLLWEHLSEDKHSLVFIVGISDANDVWLAAGVGSCVVVYLQDLHLACFVSTIAGSN